MNPKQELGSSAAGHCTPQKDTGLRHGVIVGCGDVGRRIISCLGDLPVTGLVRSEGSAREITALGGTSQVADLDSETTLPDLGLGGADVFYLAPPNPQGARDLRMTHFLSACDQARPRRIVYLSTSGVYGDCGGAWVDELRKPNPQTRRAQRRWDAEQHVQRWCNRNQVHHVILRVGGIYARNRLPEARIREGLTVICPADAPYSNRIHALDLARLCVAAARRGSNATVYNAADGHPTTMTDFFYRVADFLRLPRPQCVPLADAEGRVSPAMLSYLRESRRLDITRMNRDLRITLRYPDLDAGLSADDDIR